MFEMLWINSRGGGGVGVCVQKSKYLMQIPGIKGNVIIILSYPPRNNGNARLKKGKAWNLYLINNKEDVVVFLGLFLYVFLEESLLKKISLQNVKHWYLIIHTWSDKAIKGTVVRRKLQVMQYAKNDKLFLYNIHF